MLIFVKSRCHPHFANKWDDKIRNLVYETLSKPGIVAIGECGLDYSRKNNVPMDIQRRTFKAQLEIAYETNKPIVIHCRDMETEVFEIMKEVNLAANFETIKRVFKDLFFCKVP